MGSALGEMEAVVSKRNVGGDKLLKSCWRWIWINFKMWKVRTDIVGKQHADLVWWPAWCQKSLSALFTHFLFFLFTPTLAKIRLKLWEKCSRRVSCEQSIKEPCRKEQGGCSSSVLCMERWDFWAAVLGRSPPSQRVWERWSNCQSNVGGPMVPLCLGNLSLGGIFARWSLWSVFEQQHTLLFGQYQVAGGSQSVLWWIVHHSRAPLEEKQSPRGEAGSVVRPIAAVGKKGQALRTHRPIFRVISVHSLQSFLFFSLLKHSENTSSKGLIWSSQRLIRSHYSLDCALELKNTRCFAELKEEVFCESTGLNHIKVTAFYCH